MKKPTASLRYSIFALVLFPLIIFAQSGVSFAINGKFYHDIELISVEGGIAQFKTREGKVSAPWSSLPTSVQNSNSKLKAALEERAKATKIEVEERAKEVEKNGERFTAKVLQALGEGLLLQVWPDDRTILLRGVVEQFADGEVVSGWYKPDGVAKYTSVLGAEVTVRAYVTSKKLVLVPKLPPSSRSPVSSLRRVGGG